MSSERAIPGDEHWHALAAHHVARYVFALPFVGGKRVLDAGCGAGYGAALLASSGGAKQVVGVDIDEGAVGAARKNFVVPGLDYLVDDCEVLGRVEGGVDVISNFENIEHLREPGKFLAAAGRVLSAEGVLLVSTPDRANTPPFKDGKPANPFHVNEWYREEFAELLGRYFKTVEMRTQVESHGVAARAGAVAAMREGLMWSNPVATFLWRKMGRTGGVRSWKALEALVATGVADYPIVEPGVAAVWGKSYCHVAICRGAVRGM